jgi:hypothetical protein
MNMKNLFQRASSHWVCYSEYEIREHDGLRYVTAVKDAELKIYDPLKIANEMIVDALNAGIMCIRAKPDEAKIETEILGFAAKYGLLGFMTALPTTPDFWEYDAVYLPKNPVIRDETMDARDYINSFFPFEDDVFFRDKNKIRQDLFGLSGGFSSVVGASDRESIALSLTFRELPFGQKMSFQRGYSEQYEWIRNQFRDWASMFCSSVFYYEETDDTMKELHSLAIKAFGGVAPHYRVILSDDKPMMMWDFHSLLQEIQIILSYMITDESKPLRICRECSGAFVASDPRSRFCTHDCKTATMSAKAETSPTPMNRALGL